MCYRGILNAAPDPMVIISPHKLLAQEKSFSDSLLENPIVTRSGVLREIEWHARTLTDERGHVTLLNVGHDITERMAYEEGLKRAANALREAECRKDEFLAMLGHEMRNPLGTVSIALELADVLSDTDAALKNRELMQRQVKQLV